MFRLYVSSYNIVGLGNFMNKQIDLHMFSKSKFRMKFKLDDKDFALIRDKGIAVIENHARNIIINRLGQAYPDRDGNQTPFKGHPVFKAQHATATCCRGCLFKWHRIEKERPLTKDEIDYIVGFIMKWINDQNTSLLINQPMQISLF